MTQTKNTQEVPVGTEFKSLVADGYMTFVVTHIADVGDTTVYLAESTDSNEYGYGDIQSAFTHEEIKAKLRWS